MAGAAPRAAAAGGTGTGETVSAAIRKVRGFSGVAVSPPATGAVPGAVYEDGSGGIGPDDA
jgi:hypothetical protein